MKKILSAVITTLVAMSFTAVVFAADAAKSAAPAGGTTLSVPAGDPDKEAKTAKAKSVAQEKEADAKVKAAATEAKAKKKAAAKEAKAKKKAAAKEAKAKAAADAKEAKDAAAPAAK